MVIHSFLYLPVADYNSYLSAISAARQPSAIRALVPFMNLPGMISLGGGVPNPATFPIDGLTFSMRGVEVRI